jgi:glycosyltransferase involved in cell wall biosynthesis
MNQSTQPKVIAAMPAYNEGKYIGSLVLQARQYADEVIVVDDGSRDQTAQLAELAGATVVRHGQNQGYGSAIQSIMAEARKRNADILVIFDADAQHNPGEIPRLVEGIRAGADLVIGSREMGKSPTATYRRVGQRILSRMTRVASRTRLSDTESGFRAYSRKALDNLELKEKGMAVSSEIVTEAVAKGLRVAEVPISVTYARDSSTLNPISHGLGVFNRIIVMISERRPLLVFGAVGTMCIIAGIVLGLLVVRVLWEVQVLQVGSALLSMLFFTLGLLCISTGLILSVLVRRLGGQR